MKFCLNMCDLTGRGAFVASAAEVEALAAEVPAMVERVFVGSYFCDRRFLALGDASVAAVAEFCSARGCAATLVLPIFPQSTLAAGLARAEEILTRWSGVFDEVTVNDFGAAVWARALGLRVNWGRLFNKEARDPRYEETSLGARACALDAAALAGLQAQFGVTCVEFDPYAPALDLSPLSGADVEVALHLPHCFMSTGHICEAASAGLAATKSFRANAACGLECTRSFSVSHNEEWATGRECYLVKSGRSVFFENPGCVVAAGPEPARIIWNPDSFEFSASSPADESEYQGEVIWE